MLPDRSGDRRHLVRTRTLFRTRTVASDKDPVDGVARVGFGGLGQMQIDHRGLEAGMTKIFLNGAQADTRFEQMRGVRMSQRVSADFLAKVDLVGDQLDG